MVLRNRTHDSRGFGKPEPTPFSLIRAHLLTTWPTARWWYPDRWSGPALSEGDRALCGEHQAMLPYLRASVIIACAVVSAWCAMSDNCYRKYATGMFAISCGRTKDKETNGGISI